MNGYNFSDRVRRVLQLAREEAARLRHQYVDSEHILLGIVREGEGVAAAVLTQLNVDLKEIQKRIDKAVKKGNMAPAGPDLPYTSPAKQVLELAMIEARDLHHSYVGTEHMLLGLLRENKGIAAQVLTDVGVTLELARRETLRLLGERGASGEDIGTWAQRHGRFREILIRMRALLAQLLGTPRPTPGRTEEVATELSSLLDELTRMTNA
jgi:ATP-dependent Clp protease ATP-binding subunit ClpC